MRQCSISFDHAPQNMDATLSLTPTGLSRGNFQLWIERTLRRKAMETLRVRIKTTEVPLKGASSFVCFPCSLIFIYTLTEKKVDFLRVPGYLQHQRRKCGERNGEKTESQRKWQCAKQEVSTAKYREECIIESPEFFLQTSCWDG